MYVSPFLNYSIASLIFNTTIQITVELTENFLDYLQSYPIIFEIYGHYQPPASTSPLRKMSLSTLERDCEESFDYNRVPKRFLPPGHTAHISQPVMSSNIGPITESR